MNTKCIGNFLYRDISRLFRSYFILDRLLGKTKKLVLGVIANVRNLNSNVATINVFRDDGNVIMMTIAETEVTKHLAKLTNVPLISSNVNPATVSKRV